MKTALDFLKFFASLTPERMINIVLVCAIIFVGAWSFNSQENYRTERDEFKTKYDTLYKNYTIEVQRNVNNTNQISKDCNDRYNSYVEVKNAEINKLVIDFNDKYNKLLREVTKYSNKNNTNE